ncbi:glycosyltransferase family 2 protein [Enterobacter roggenkampii]|uniref:glycosyltransferase family 2 protein n=1 Tax=Enterobacter roggenkampii TaxID=1812935 RepID=UPI002542BB0E|nr:glycosyltransferase family 2 protein [Enterobacter roggenkampii]WIJ48681.1 glycosyltransferase family 2 protein [Enterobacter roggenkampii]WIJ77511.1 glycosyltransferase family 2 protein [Enterobacter roggenkampii]
MNKISLVVPVFNEEDAIPIFYRAVNNNEFLSKMNFEIIFINDGSTDRTEDVVTKIISDDKRVMLINLSRNFGKEKALFAGLSIVSSDFIVPIDVDLQDPIELIEVMYDCLQNQSLDVVLAKRVERSSDTYLKRKTAELFYKTHNKLSDVKLEANVGDFRMMRMQVVRSITQMSESQLFMKGIFAWVGYKTAVVEYNRSARVAGNSKFNGWKLWNLAVEGITSFSIAPLKIWVYLGGAISLLSFIYAMNLIAQKIFFGNPVAGYPSIMVAILFLGGVQLIGIRVLGEYLGRCYMETKQRPKFIIKDIVRNQDIDDDAI